MSLRALAESALPCRSAEHIEALLEKIHDEGITHPLDLVLTSEQALQQKFMTHASLDFTELADLLSLVDFVRRDVNAPGGGVFKRNVEEVVALERSRSRSRRPCVHVHGLGLHKRNFNGHVNVSGGEVFQGNVKEAGAEETGLHRSRSRSVRKRNWNVNGNGRYSLRGCHGGRSDGCLSSPSWGSYPKSQYARFERCDEPKPYRKRQYGQSQRPDKPMPDLWAAVANGNELLVDHLLKQRADPNERFHGWPPLLKAAEQNHSNIVYKLVSNGAQINLENGNKGRSALSFAAAPSKNLPTAMSALKMLLECGADPEKRDDDNLTAEERAKKERRTEAVALFEEFRTKTGAFSGPLRQVF